ncbi:winged helix DNA-binding domain-containing protein [Antrihabitans sp. NCIMB 15449]|jgi:hypothetical protein|uniref:Winged helix DNA-binding domain-containing protein n=1 Tax=Antrihabitans spumae TaxID=3373370 RepID=A0ABW7JIZ3_9NOCA
MSDVLTNRVLNRTLLARQHLLERSTLGIAEMLEHLIGLQAQDVPPPFVALFSRLTDFDPNVVSAGLDDRSFVRITLMRGTIHLVTAQDALRIAPHVQPQLEKVPFRKGFHFGATVGMDPDDVRARGERLLGDEPIAAAELRKLAAAEWPDRDGQAMLQVLLYLLPVLQTPPRGKWKHNNRPVWARTEAWLGRPLDGSYPVDDLIERYLRAFGPATTMDMQAWSKLVGLKEVVERLGSRLRTYTDESGRTLYDVADGELADPDLPAPVRYLGWYDNALLSHKDRTRIVPEGLSISLASMSANRSAMLLDGYLAGLYIVRTEGDRATLELATAHGPLSRRDADAVEAEGLALLDFLEPDKTPTVEFVGTR